MSSALIETININADDFTDNFLTCPTCMLPYDDSEHTPKLLPCSHTLCRSCLDRIASTAIPINNGSGINLDSLNSSPTILINNSISRSIAAADAAVAAINGSNTLPVDQNGSPRLSVNSSRLSSTSLTSNNRNLSNSNQQFIDLCIRCPICRETIVLPRNGGIANLPPSFIVNQLLDLVKNQRSRDIVPRCVNHTNEELLFCETCDKSFCSLCESHFKMAANADHIIIPFSIAIKRMTEIFLFKSNQCINSFNLALANVQSEIVNLNKTVENVAQLVEKSFDDLKLVIDKRKQELLRDLTSIKDNKTSLLNDQIKLIVNEKQKIELECKQYHQKNIESKQLGQQIQNINEKLDCLRTLCEPRENCFINYEYKFNNCIQEIDNHLKKFGRFKISNTYPPLCNYRIHSTNTVYSANLAIEFQIETVDYYGQKRKDGGDPVSITITDPFSRQVNVENIQDLNNGSYYFKFIPNIVGKYRLDINIFSRSVNKSPLYLNIVDYVESLWSFGGVGTSSQVFSFNNKGSSDRDFNMPISVRCLDNKIYILDSGNNRIKILSEQGHFIGHLKHDGLAQSSSTALAISESNLITMNWRLKQLSKLNIDDSRLENFSIDLDEPINIMETFHSELFIVQDNKKKLYLCTIRGEILFDSLETKIKTECGLKNITCFCANFSDLSIYVADASNSSSSVYEIDLDWLTNFTLDNILESHNLKKITWNKSEINCRKLISPLNQKMLSSSLTSLNSTISSSSTLTTFTTNSSTSCSSSKSCGNYTALWQDKNTNKLLAAKSDKQKTVVEIFDLEKKCYQYSIECSQSEKNLKRVTSICTNNSGQVVCVDLVQNFVKMFKFV